VEREAARGGPGERINVSPLRKKGPLSYRGPRSGVSLCDNLIPQLSGRYAAYWIYDRQCLSKVISTLRRLRGSSFERDASGKTLGRHKAVAAARACSVLAGNG